MSDYIRPQLVVLGRLHDLTLQGPFPAGGTTKHYAPNSDGYYHAKKKGGTPLPIHS